MDENYRTIFEGNKLDDNKKAADEAESHASGNGDELDSSAENANPNAHSQTEQDYVTDENEAAAEEPNMPDPNEDFNNISDSLNEIKSSNDAVAAKLEDMSKQIETLKSAVTRLSAYDTAVETLKQSLAVHKTHESNLNREVEEYKKGTYFTNIRPFLNFLIDILCELKKSKAQYIEDKDEFISENNEAVYNEIINLIDFYIGFIEGQIKIQGVTITSYEPDSDYISGSQRITKTVKTDDADKNGKIARVISDCYSYEKTILRPASVTVYKA